jgi:NADP-dependent 3-hydroxy acid dehydrogenase YdfG
MNRIVVITGASSGIGEATAKKFAKNGDNLILLARRIEKLEHLKKEILSENDVNILIYKLDVRNKEEVFNFFNNLKDEWKNIDILVNNAGLALGLSPIYEGNVEDWEIMVQTNIMGLLYVSRAILPGMVKRKKGHIINLGSIAGREVYENGNVYCATKHAVHAISEAMRIDLLPYNIKVSNVAPGAVNTEFSIVRFKGDKQRAEQVYVGYNPLMAEDIADAIMYVSNLPENVNVNDILVMSTNQANATIFNKNS